MAIITAPKDRGGYQNIFFRGDRLQEYPSDVIELQVHMPCRRCNSTWMSDLENLARPIIGPMATEGASVTLSREVNAALAQWITKTVMTLEYLGAKSRLHFTTEERRDFMRPLVPPFGIGIWVGRYVGRAPAFRTSVSFRMQFNDGVTVVNHVTTVSLGQLVFQLLSNMGGETRHWEKVPIQPGP